MKQDPIVVFSTPSYDPLVRHLLDHPGFEKGAVERTTFPDSERYQRILTPVAGRDVVVLGGTVDDEATLDIYDLGCGLVHLGAHTLTLVIPWYGYQTMERAVLPGETVKAKTRARLLSSIPTAGSGNRVVMVDLHFEGITQYFSGSIRPVHLSATPVVLDQIQAIAGDDDYVLGATDAGRAKWVERLANALGVDAGFVFKRRTSGEATEVMALAADVKGKTVVIYDDMIRTGGSLLGAARAYRGAGAARIAAVCTHGVFPGDGLERLQASGLLDGIVCTDTHPRAMDLADHPFCHVASIGTLLSEHLRRHR